MARNLHINERFGLNSWDKTIFCHRCGCELGLGKLVVRNFVKCPLCVQRKGLFQKVLLASDGDSKAFQEVNTLAIELGQKVQPKEKLKKKQSEKAKVKRMVRKNENLNLPTKKRTIRRRLLKD